MPTPARAGLNDSGEDALARIVRGGALHVSRGARTSSHAHYAWKVHVGLDAPVWYQSRERAIHGAAVLLIPPGVEHSTGAIGWSCAFFISPGSHGTPWRAALRADGAGESPDGPRCTVALRGAQAQRLVNLARDLHERPRDTTADGIAAVSALCAAELSGPRTIDARVAGALERLRQSPDVTLPALARAAGLSLDRLSRLVSQGTGMRLRQLALWSRLLHLLSQGGQHTSVASAAYAAGFADHAHLTRTYRRMLGRAPSEFRAPPDVVQHW
jgi:AraC-like DNA-binding protein